MNLNKYKSDFPILNRIINGHPLVYLDNAATTQKPQIVIDVISNFYLNSNANVHRGIHTLSEEATSLFEEARNKVANFIGATKEEIVFTSGTTDSINHVASWFKNILKPGDVILTTDIEHHSNLVPWQEVAKATGATLQIFSVDQTFDLNGFKKVINERVKLVAVTHASNVLGTIFPIKEITKIAHDAGALVLVDGAQAVPHIEVNMQSFGCDFYTFSGHKMLAATGIGVLYIAKKLHSKFDPQKFGGGMIDQVELQSSTYALSPEKYEAGTPNIEGAISLGVAIDYLTQVGMSNIREHEVELTKYCLEKLSEIKGIKILGPMDANLRTGLVAFNFENMHSHDIASILDTKGVAVRSGHHCAMPLHVKHKMSSTTRASFYLYNTTTDIDILIDSLKECERLLLQ